MTLTKVPIETTREAVLAALVGAKGSREAAAEALAISRATLQRRLRELWSAEELAALGKEHGWPARTEAARAARWVICVGCGARAGSGKVARARGRGRWKEGRCPACQEAGTGALASPA